MKINITVVRVKTPIMFQFISTPGLNTQHVVLIIRIFPATLSPALLSGIYESFSAPQRITSWPLTNSFKTTPQQKPQNQVPTLAPAACWFSTQCLKHRKRASAASRIGSWQWRLSMTSTPKENLNEIGTCICHMVYGFMQIRTPPRFEISFQIYLYSSSSPFFLVVKVFSSSGAKHTNGTRFKLSDFTFFTTM